MKSTPGRIIADLKSRGYANAGSMIPPALGKYARDVLHHADQPTCFTAGNARPQVVNPAVSRKVVSTAWRRWRSPLPLWAFPLHALIVRFSEKTSMAPGGVHGGNFALRSFPLAHIFVLCVLLVLLTLAIAVFLVYFVFSYVLLG